LILYAVAKQGGRRIEFYVPLEDRRVIGWTPDLNIAWCIEVQGWAEMVRTELMRRGFAETFLWAFREDWIY